MPNEPNRVRIGERLRGDAVGDLHVAERGGEPMGLRILREDLVGREDARMLFEEEVRRIARLDHAALLRVRQVERAPPRPWMLTDPVDGPSLEAVLGSDGPLEAQAALELAAHVADGFAYLEARKQVHAAPVPARLLRVADGWRLLTFRDIRAWDELKTRKGKPFPAPCFAPPELARAHPEPLRPAPFLAWSVGALLRFAAGGGAPCAENGLAAPLPADFPADLAPIVGRLLAWEPEARPQGRAALSRALAGEATGPAPTGGKRFQAPVAKRKRDRRGR